GISATTITGSTITASGLITGNAGLSTTTITGSTILASGLITANAGISSTTGTFSSTLSANGGITFDSPTDTVGAFTAAGNIDMNTNALFNIGNSGTDFITGTGGLNLAGNLDTEGVIRAGSGNETLTLSTGKIDADAITLTAAGTTGAINSSSGL